MDSLLSYYFDGNIDAYLADGKFRKQDPRFIGRDRYQPKDRKAKWFKAEDFETNNCAGSAGKAMWSGGKRIIDGNEYVTFIGYLNTCRDCPLQENCMRHPAKDCGRQMSIMLDHKLSRKLNVIDRMKTKIDSDKGRHMHSKRLGLWSRCFAISSQRNGLTDSACEEKRRSMRNGCFIV